MAEIAVAALGNSMEVFTDYSKEKAELITRDESLCDEYEDALVTYLIKLSAEQLGENESEESAVLLKVIGDFERISDLGAGNRYIEGKIKNKSYSQFVFWSDI